MKVVTVVPAVKQLISNFLLFRRWKEYHGD
jgi:hypothetical protein